MTIDRLQNYFGIALSKNTDNLKAMKLSVCASLFNNLHYSHCPTGPTSWCKYNRDIANNTATYKPGPGLPMDIVMKLRPMYIELRWLHGKTQNQNESFNATIWERIPKSTYVSLKHLKLGVHDAVSNFNIGQKASVLLYEKLKMIPGVFTIQGCIRLNRNRLSLSQYKNAYKNNLQHKKLRGKK